MDTTNFSEEFVKLLEFVRSATPNQITAYLERQRKSIQNLREQISQNPSPQNKHVAYMNLLTYVDRQTYMLGRFIGEPIECTAWIARNLYEANLIVKYLDVDEKKAETFLKSQLACDELEILKGFSGLNFTNSDKSVEAHRNTLELRMSQIRESLEKSNLKVKGNIPTGTLADLADERNSHNAYFNFYSKYVHPSSWIINATQQQVGSQEHRTMFFVEAVMSASKIVAQTAVIFNLDYDSAPPEF